MSKWYYTRDEVGKFTGKLTLMKKISNHIKLKLWFLAKVCVLAWLIVGGIKVGQHVTPVNTVYADREIIKEVRVKAPVMERIAKCEAGGQHGEKATGQVVMRSNTNKTVDIGKYQINTVWFKKAHELGYDVTTEKGNEDMAYWLYENRGTNDWYASRDCWAK